MKKLLLVVLFLGTSINVVNAKNSNKDLGAFLYIGAGHQISNVDYKIDKEGDSAGCLENCKNNFEERYNDANFFVGRDITDNIALEIGYYRTKNEVKQDTLLGVSSETNLKIINLDTVLSRPIIAGSNHKFLGILTLSDIRHASSSILGDAVDNGYGYGVGLGIEIAIDKAVAVQAFSKISNVKKISYIDDIASYGLNFKIKLF